MVGEDDYVMTRSGRKYSLKHDVNINNSSDTELERNCVQIERPFKKQTKPRFNKMKIKKSKTPAKKRISKLAKMKDKARRYHMDKMRSLSKSKGKKRGISVESKYLTPKKKLRETKPPEPTLSPFPKIILKLPEKVKQHIRRRKQQKMKEESKPIVKVEVKKKEVSIKDVLRQFNFIDRLTSSGTFFNCSSFLPLIVVKECGNRRFPSKSRAKLVDIPHNTLYSLIHILKIYVIKQVQVYLTLFLTEECTEKSTSVAMSVFWLPKEDIFVQETDESDSRAVRVAFEVKLWKVKNEIGVLLKTEPSYLDYLPKEKREVLLLRLFLLSVFVQHYTKQSIRNYQRIMLKQTKNQVSVEYCSNKDNESYHYKIYSISSKLQQNRWEDKESEIEKEEEEDIVEELSHSQQQSSIHYFDVYNVCLAFSFETMQFLSSIELKCLFGSRVRFSSKDSTSRVCIIEKTRMSQVGCTLNLDILSPLMFRLQVEDFEIAAQKLKYLDMLAKSLLFNTKQTMVKLVTKADSSNDSIISKRYINSWKQYLNAKEFVFKDYLESRQIQSFNDSQAWFRNGNFLCLHFDLEVDEENKVFWLKPLESEDIEVLRAADVKLGFLVKRTHGHENVRKVHYKKIFENSVSFRDVTAVEGYYLYNEFEKRSKELYDQNNCVRFDLFVSNSVWETIVKQRCWLRHQFQSFVSVCESHIKVIFRNWCSKELTRLVSSHIKQKNYQDEVTQVLDQMVESIETDKCCKKRQNYFTNWKLGRSSEDEDPEFLQRYLYSLIDSLQSSSINGIYSYISDKTNVKNMLSRLAPNCSNRISKHIPHIFTSTRDSFKINLLAYDVLNKRVLSEEALVKALAEACSEKGIRVIEWCFDPCFGIPEDYIPRQNDIISENLFKVGVRTYLGVFTDREFTAIEKETDDLYELSKHARTYQHQLEKLGIEDEVLVKRNREKERRYFNDNTAHHVFNKKKCIRTKMFFNYRYLWTKEEMKHKDSKIANGIRSDPSRIPKWMISRIQDKLTDVGIIKPRLESEDPVASCLADMVNKVERDVMTKKNGYEAIEMNVNSFAVNIYHDGSIGLSQHFDDAQRFRANIVSMRLYSDSRLSFDCKYFGCTNGRFTVDMPRGSLQVLDNDSYAGKKVTHCIRASDMMGKSGVLLLREIQPKAVREADEFLIRQTAEKFTKLNLATK